MSGTFKMITLLCWVSVTQSAVFADERPTVPRLHHYDEKTVLQFSTGTPGSVSMDTNLLLLEKISHNGVIEHVPLPRTDKMMAEGIPICTFNRVKSAERSEKFLFSLPVNFFVSFRLYQHADVPPISDRYITPEGAVKNLAQLLQETQTRLLVPLHFSFGNPLDQEIKSLKSHQRVDIEGTHYFQQLVGMFESRRAEFAFIYPSSLYTHFKEKRDVLFRSYRFDGVPEILTGHLMCSDTPQSREFLKSADAALRKLYHEKAFKEAHTRYLASAEKRIVLQAIQQMAAN